MFEEEKIYTKTDLKRELYYQALDYEKRENDRVAQIKDCTKPLREVSDKIETIYNYLHNFPRGDTDKVVEDLQELQRNIKDMMLSLYIL